MNKDKIEHSLSKMMALVDTEHYDKKEWMRVFALYNSRRNPISLEAYNMLITEEMRLARNFHSFLLGAGLVKREDNSGLSFPNVTFHAKRPLVEIMMYLREVQIDIPAAIQFVLEKER